MARRNLARFAGALLTTSAIAGALVACGNATVRNNPPPATFDAGPPLDATVPPIIVDAMTPPTDTTIPYDGGITVQPDATVATCVSKTCAQLNYTCGLAVDNCGKVINCNAGGADGAVCPPNEVCGAATPNQCSGGPTIAPDGSIICTPTDCTTKGYTCGQMDDGCGNLLDCGGPTACVAPAYCGGGGYNVCGTDAGTACTSDGGICHSIAACDGGVVTTITGSVHAPLPVYLDAGAAVGDPVPNVVVYIAQKPVDPFTDAGVQCSVCGADISGDPLGVPVKTAFDGTFKLTNVPSGVSSLNLVIQLGHWRKVVPVGPFTACQTTALPVITMPRNKSEGDIPLTAISTGAVDGLECVLRKMGVSDSEFTASSGAGRVQIFSSTKNYNATTTAGAGAVAPTGSGTSLPEVSLTGATDAGAGTLMKYDQVLFPCWGEEDTKDTNALANLVTYADHGGHFFATHYSYSWMYHNAEFSTAASWNVGQSFLDAGTGTVQIAGNPEGAVFASWLNLVGALSNGNGGSTPYPTPANINIVSPRHDVDAVQNGSVDWIDGTDPTLSTKMIMHFTANTPITPAPGQTQCGHVIFSDFHVADTQTSPSTHFPAECDTNPMSPQEKVLEYMIWDLASCIPDPTPPVCVPTTCTALGFQCGPAGDGCGNAIDGGCGDCPAGAICGGPAGLGHCYTPDAGSCVPTSCPSSQHCGPAADGCGNILDCGDCVSPDTCGGGGVAGQCGHIGNK